jgi:hypothetical protein
LIDKQIYSKRPPNPPLQPTAAREIEGILTVLVVRLRQLNGNPLDGALSNPMMVYC